jgi:hypothetical protein
MDVELVATAGALAMIVAAAIVARLRGARHRRARRALESPAPPAPIPAPWRARATGAARRAAPAAPTASPAGRPSSAPDIDTELARLSSGSPFRLQTIARSPEFVLAEIRADAAPADAGGVARTDDASRAHALLCDRLAQAGWDACGRGEAWYGHRFRRSLAKSGSRRAAA